MGQTKKKKLSEGMWLVAFDEYSNELIGFACGRVEIEQVINEYIATNLSGEEEVDIRERIVERIVIHTLGDRVTFSVTVRITVDSPYGAES